MKSWVTTTLGAALFVLLLGAYLFAYATTVRDPVEWKSGDLVVLNMRETETLPLFAADGSGVTHIGIVEAGETGAVVIEAAKQVVETPLREFLSRGRGNAYAVYRIAALTDQQRSAVVAAARRQLGKPNDYFLRRNWDQLYSSELVRLAYNDIGFDLGRQQRISKIAGDLSGVRSQFSRNWMAHDDCRRRNLDMDQCWTLVSKQEVVTPASIVADAHMTKVYEVKAPDKTVTLSNFAGLKPEGPAQ
jgi:hypothetical protein